MSGAAPGPRPHAPPAWIHVLLRDRALRVVLLVGVTGYAFYSLPLLGSKLSLDLFERLWDVLLILICGGLVVAAARRREAQPLERRFWSLWVAGLGCWLAVYTLDLGARALAAASGGETAALGQGENFHLLRSLLFTGLYLGPALGLTQVPHLAGPDVRRSSYRRLEAVGTVVMIFSLFVYFAVVPLALLPEGSLGALAPSRYYFFLDCYLVVVLAARWLEAPPSWRAPYAALLLVPAAWAVADGVETVQLGGWINGELGGVLLDAVWIWPFVGLAVAARLRAHAPAEPERQELTLLAPPRSILLLQIVALPLIHVAYRSLGSAPQETLWAQRACVIVSTVLLLGLALAERRRVTLDLEHAARMLEERNRELEQLVVEFGAARDRAEAGDRAKSQFLANTSHEIRTPMHGVLGMTDMLLDTPLDAHQRRLIETLRQSADSLLSLIEEILDLSRIEAGRLELECEPVDPSEVAEEVRSLMAPRARAKGLALTCETHGTLTAPLVGDPGRLRQVLLNLVDNGIKFTERGEVSLVVRRLEVSATHARVGFEVADTGAGIPAAERARIFDSFTQLEGDRNRRHEGSGLGLSICRQLVRLMGGEIEVESEVGSGSTFRFELTFAKAAGRRPEQVARPAAVEAENALPRRLAGRVLVAEDDPVNQVVIVGLLSKLGVEPEVVGDGQTALEALSRTSYDLVLMDSMMPGLDGEAAVAELRRREAAAGIARTPVAAVTASARSEDRERCLAAGMDDFLSKPFRAEQLEALLARWLPVAPGGEQPAGEPALPVEDR